MLPGPALKWKVQWDYEDAVEENFIAPLRYLEHLTPEHLSHAPKQLTCTPVGKEWPDMISNSRQWVVRAAVKVVVEDLEPRIHTFIPVHLQSRKQSTPELFYFLRVGQAIDAVVIERSKFVGGYGKVAFREGKPLSDFGNTTLRSNQIMGKHLWRGGWARTDGHTDPFWGDIFCSDDLCKRIKAAKFRDCSFVRCEVE